MYSLLQVQVPHRHRLKPSSGYQCSTVEIFVFLSFNIFLHLFLQSLLQIGCVELNPGRRKRLLCGSCKKHLGKSTKKRPLFWCTICGWVHFTCSGLSNATQYIASSFVCLKCAQDHVISDALTNNPNFQKAHKFYSDTNKSSAFGNSQTLAQHTGLPVKTVQQYLSTSATYTKFRQAVAISNV